MLPRIGNGIFLMGIDRSTYQSGTAIRGDLFAAIKGGFRSATAANVARLRPGVSYAC